MRSLRDMNTIHVEITNACNLECANCTRFVGHHRKPFFMDLDMVETALRSLQGFPGNIGIMGGEPTLHPKFREICELVQQLVPNKKQRHLWTNGKKYSLYKDVIEETFLVDNIIYNDHKDEDEIHQPLMIAAKDVVEDQDLMWDLIDQCWVNDRWAASITPKGGFFCEVAAAQDHLFDGPGGYELDQSWWDRDVESCKDQINRYCQNCSAAIPMPTFENQEYSICSKDLVSESVARRLETVKSRRHKLGNTRLFTQKFSAEDIEEHKKSWMPWSHRSFKQFGPDIVVNER